MYTQCPECKVTFRVNAQILQQAAGKVRCGSCGEAFNALDYLSENPPSRTSNAPTAAHPGERARSQKLMDTLNQFVGPENVRIEDTGIEWRVIDPDEVAAAKADSAGFEGGKAAGHGDEEPRYDDNTPIPDDFFDDELPPPTEELAGRAAKENGEPYTDDADDVDDFDDAQPELELSHPEEWADLLDEFSDPAETETVDEIRESPQPASEDADVTDSGGAMPELDEPVDDGDDGFYDNELTLSGDAGEDIDMSGPDTPEDTGAAPDREFLAAEGPGDAGVSAEHDDTGARAADAEHFEARIEVEDLDEEDVEEYELDDDLDDNRDDIIIFGTQGDEAEAARPEKEDGAEANDDDADGERADEEASAFDDFAAMTANMQIDPKVLQAMRDGTFDAATDDDGSPMVETIIMEGDFVRDSLEEMIEMDREAKDDDEEPRASTGDTSQASLLDTYIARRLSDSGRGGRSVAMITGIALLGLVLAGQLVHSQREYLATFDAFDETLGTIYRQVGMPVTPDWNVKGWQFEATSGSTGAGDQILTINSRISNRSAEALPYPLVHVSLTDRYEEIIGSRLFEPGDYLEDGSNPAAPVGAGENFTATMTLDSIPAQASGFKLNVCYREPANQLRCAIDDFKNP